MKNIIIIAAIFLAALLLFGQPKQTFKSVDVNEFEKIMSDTTSVLLDVRTPSEYAEGHIPGTNYNIDVLEDNFEFTALKVLPTEKTIALYCRSGNRSKTAAKILSSKGYKVVELSNGFKGWTAAGRPVE